MFLLGNGYAPVFTVRDGSGEVVSPRPVPFLPRDGNITSIGVVKVPGATPQQLGFDGRLPADRGRSTRGRPASRSTRTSSCPAALLSVYTGDLGVDSGTPQSVYQLDTRGMTQVLATDGSKLVAGWRPGTTADAADGGEHDHVRRGARAGRRCRSPTTRARARRWAPRCSRWPA